MKKNPYIHGLRGVLSFSLFLFHVANSGLPRFQGFIPDVLNYIMLSLQHGVELFFGISGIVIVFAFLSARSLGDFLKNRATRIFPVLWVTVLCIAVLSSLDKRHELALSPLIIIENLLALPSVFPVPIIHPAAWSISYEFTFYFMFVLFSLISRFGSRKIAAWVVGILSVLLMATYLRSICFVLGVAIVLLHRKGAKEEAFLKYAGVMVFTAMLAFRTSFLLAAQNGDYQLSFVLEKPASLAFLGAGLITAFYGLKGVFYGKGRFAAMLCHPVLQWLGTISFSLYLWQTIVMAITKKMVISSGLLATLGPCAQLALFAVSLLPTLYVSHVSQIYLENRLTRWLRNRKISPDAP